MRKKGRGNGPRDDTEKREYLGDRTEEAASINKAPFPNVNFTLGATHISKDHLPLFVFQTNIFWDFFFQL